MALYLLYLLVRSWLRSLWRGADNERFDWGSCHCWYGRGRDVRPLMTMVEPAENLVGLTFSRYIGVMTLLSVNTTEHERPVYIGMTGLTWGLGTVLGPVSPLQITFFLAIVPKTLR